MKRLLATATMVVATLGWLVVELVFAFDDHPWTPPLTHVVTNYVPWWVGVPAAGLLALWLPWHFIHAYRQRRIERANLAAGTPRPINPEPID